MVSHSMFAMKVYGIRIMFSEDVKRMYQWVFIAKQTPYATLFLFIDLKETILGHVPIFFH